MGADKAKASSMQITGTPGFLINGGFLNGGETGAGGGAGVKKTRRSCTWLVALLSLMLLPAAVAAQVSLGVNRLLIVSAAGSATQNCQNLRDALASITSAAVDNPYVLRLEPGEYDCGSTAVTMKSYVDLEGSGEGVTRIIGAPEADPSELGVIDMADEMELRFVTVEHTGNSGGALCIGTAVSARSGESRITHSTLVAQPADCNSCGVFMKGSATLRIDDSSVKGDLDGIFMQDGTSTVVVHRSTVEGTNDVGIVMVAGDAALLAYSQLINGFDTTQGGSLTCLYSYDGSLAELDSGCSPPAP